MNNENMNNGVNNTPVNPEVLDVQTPVMPVQPIQQALVSTVPVTPVPEPVQTVVQDIPVADPINTGANPYTPLNNGNVGFVATGETLEKKKGKGGLIAIILIIIAILGIGGFFLFKFFLLPLFVQPKQVFETAISTVSKEINTSVSSKLHNKSIYSIQADVDSNIELFKTFSGYKYNFKYGYDHDNKLLEIGYGIKDPYEVDHSFYSYVKDDKTYERYSNYQSLIYTGAFTESSDLNKLFNKLSTSQVSSEDATYIVNKISNEIINTFDESKFTKEDVSVVVNGETINGVKNKYSLDYNGLYSTYKTLAKSIVEDEKALKILASINKTTTGQLEEKLNNFINKEYVLKSDESSLLDIIIYTSKRDMSFLGFEVIADNKLYDESNKLVDSYSKIQYQTYNGNFNVYIYSKSEALKNESSLSIVGVNKGDHTAITVKDKDTKYAYLRYKNLNNGYNIEYTLYEAVTGSKEGITGSLDYTVKTSENKETGTYNLVIRGGDEYIKVNVIVDNDWGYDVANINTGASVSLSEAEIQNIELTFNNDLKTNTPGEFMKTIYDYIVYEKQPEIFQIFMN